jgi:glycosyltransferase involved in cell wall biosynthesis
VKVLIVAEGRYPDFVGGAETVIAQLGRTLQGRGHEVHTLTRRPRAELPEYECDGGVHVHRYAGPAVRSPLYWLYPLASWWKARQWLRALDGRVRFDAVIFNQPFGALGGLGPARRMGARTIYVFHSAAHLELRAALAWSGRAADASLGVPLVWVRRLEGRALRACDEIVTLSRYMRDAVVACHRISPHRVRIVPGGVDTEMFSPVMGADEKRRLRERLGIPVEDFVLFVAKRMYAGMGLESLIEAVRQLTGRPAARGVRLLLAGDGPVRRRIEEFVRDRGVADRVRLLGNVPHDEMAGYYRAADLYVSTRPEPFGLVTLEALACGLPVVSVPAGATAEILEGLSKDLLFTDDRPESMATLIQDYLRWPDELTELGARCRRYVEDHYGWSVVGERMEQLLCGPGGPGREL